MGNGEYFSGPGTRAIIGDNPFIFKWFAGAFGLGTSALVDRAYNKIKTGSKDSEINIFCYSRGAYAGRVLASRLAQSGYKVNFLGCFDTVGALGIPFDILGIPFQQINLFGDITIHKNVIRAAHALASRKYEKRRAFINSPMKARAGITQKYFKGDHGFVGSSNLTLAWMLDQFEGK